MRIAVDGLTASRTASATSLVSPRASTTSMRNWGSVTRSSAVASDRAETATSRRDAVRTAPVTAFTSSSGGSGMRHFYPLGDPVAASTSDNCIMQR